MSDATERKANTAARSSVAAIAPHTPGPWHVVAGTVIFAGETKLCRTLEASTEMGDADKFFETRANAALIAAAPDLLGFAEWTECLLGCAAELGLHLDADKKELLAMAQAVIKKARGQ